MLIQNFFSAVSYGVLDPESAKEKARLKQQEENRRLGFPDRPVHGLPSRIPPGLDLVDAADARYVCSGSAFSASLVTAVVSSVSAVANAVIAVSAAAVLVVMHLLLLQCQ